MLDLITIKDALHHVLHFPLIARRCHEIMRRARYNEIVTCGCMSTSTNTLRARRGGRYAHEMTMANLPRLTQMSFLNLVGRIARDSSPLPTTICPARRQNYGARTRSDHKIIRSTGTSSSSVGLIPHLEYVASTRLHDLRHFLPLLHLGLREGVEDPLCDVLPVRTASTRPRHYGLEYTVTGTIKGSDLPMKSDENRECCNGGPLLRAGGTELWPS